MGETSVHVSGSETSSETHQETSNVMPKTTAQSGTRKGISFSRFFTKQSISPYEQVEWELRTASIANEKGKVIFEQRNVEAPKSWSQTATNIVSSKYLHGKLGTPERESSVRQLVSRVVDTIAEWGRVDGYFATDEDAANFRDELAHLMLQQKASFNSPVWFNCGVERCEPEANFPNWHWSKTDQKPIYESTGYRNPQCSACFINSVDDTLDSILTLAKTEGMLFKWGSGTGSNLSALRSADESLSGGGSASGPISFMRGYDAFAGVIKSGGKTRRAAKMVILNIDHPDIVEFIECKAKEERKAWTLVDAGYDSSLDGEAYSSIFFQNANNSVRVTDEFMKAVLEDGRWTTREVTTGKVAGLYKAKELLQQIAQATHQCGDPGMQFDTIINRWHTSKASGRINASNPCSEYMFLDDTACNLSSLNLLNFLSGAGHFEVEAFRHAVDTMIVAQEILVDHASYPTEKIGMNSHNYRPLGLGYANLGALLMACGLPYDSEAGRDYAAAVTALMHGQAYLTSARLAAAVEPFPHYEQNREHMLEVIEMHRAALDRINPRNLTTPALLEAARQTWKDCCDLGSRYGYRNSQVTVLAPTGTIGFMMDCNTTGVEPDLALVKFKKLVGGGLIKVVNNTVPTALLRMGYSSKQVDEMVDFIDHVGTIENAPHLKPEHLPVFDCSFRPPSGKRSIHYMGHLRMMGAVQPFLSGAISKTVNLPEDATAEDIMETYIAAWKLGLKAVAIYRDGSKRVQPLRAAADSDHDADRQGTESTVPPDAAREESVAAERMAPAGASRKPIRHKLPEERQAITHKFSIGGHEGYITAGMYEDGQPGEIFIVMAKEGSSVSGLMDSFATAISLALQYGVPLKVLVYKFAHTRFEPSGWTGNKNIPYAKSIMDYIFRWLAVKFIPGYQAGIGLGDGDLLGAAPPPPSPAMDRVREQTNAAAAMTDAPTCADCGSIMTRNGSCYKCENCGSTSGCS